MKKIIGAYKNLPVQARASFWFLICSFLQRGISVITTPIFTRILSTSEYGQFSVFNSWMLLVGPIISLNLSSGVYSQGVVKFEDDRAKFSSALQGLSVTLIFGWFLIYIFNKEYFNSLLSLDTFQMVAMIIARSMAIW